MKRIAAPSLIIALLTGFLTACQTSPVGDKSALSAPPEQANDASRETVEALRDLRQDIRTIRRTRDKRQ